MALRLKSSHRPMFKVSPVQPNPALYAPTRLPIPSNPRVVGWSTQIRPASVRLSVDITALTVLRRCYYSYAATFHRTAAI
ncbi:hypothetical protein AB1N83_004138 [Pleurotus pulmonarius]